MKFLNIKSNKIKTVKNSQREKFLYKFNYIIGEFLMDTPLIYYYTPHPKSCLIYTDTLLVLQIFPQLYLL